MVNGANPSCAGNGAALRVRNRDHRYRGKSREEHLMLRQVEPAMQRGDEWCRLAGKQGKRIIIEMKVQQIELVSPLANALEHGHVQRIRVADRAVQTQCLRPTCLQLGGGFRIAAREQDDVMSERDELVGQPRNNTLRAAIELRRNGLGQRGYLRDLHGTILFRNAAGLAGSQLQSLTPPADGARES